MKLNNPQEEAIQAAFERLKASCEELEQLTGKPRVMILTWLMASVLEAENAKLRETFEQEVKSEEDSEEEPSPEG